MQETGIAQPGVTGIQPAKRNRSGLIWRFRRASPLALIFAGVVSIFYLTIFIIPFGTAIWLSFQNWDYLTKPKFVGLRNFVKIFTDAYFWQALKATVLFSAVEITCGVCLAVLLALALSQIMGRTRNLFLVLYYLPVITPSVVAIYLWSWLYRPTGGAF